MVAGTRLFWSSVFALLVDHADAGSSLSAEQWFGRLNALRTVGLSLPTVVRTGLAGPGWLTSALLVVNALLVASLSARGAAAAGTRPRTAVLRRAGVLWCGSYAVVALAVSFELPVAAVLLLAGVVLLSGAEVLHAPASAALVGALAGAARGRYLAVFQYSFVLAELVGPLMFTGLFAVVPALPFAVLAVVSLLAAVVLHGSGSLRAPTPRRW